MKESIKRKTVPVLIAVVWICCFLLTGCSSIDRDTKIVLTTGFRNDEVFRIESASCYKKEVMVYLTNIQNQYEQVYGREIWEQGRDGVTLEDSVKESVLAELAQIKTMNLMAEKYGLALNEAEKESVKEAAAVYFDSLTATEKKQLDVSRDTIRHLYTEYALANKVYAYLIQDINPEISDDEARTITLQQILVKNGREDENGVMQPFTDEEWEYAYKKAIEARRQIEDGEDFEVVASIYNEAGESTVYIRKGDKDAAFEEVAFSLGNGEVSRIFEAEDGFYILKCISTLNREETDSNKVKIVEERRKEAFSREYDSFVETLTRDINREVWQEIEMLHDEEITTSDFFEIYQEHCGS